MAFNFNWSPLTTDPIFYTRAQELLTAALNKSPRPPIIVDDIIVNELNLGHVPPELEILEIGDLAEDRFRGIFKMSYNGDAYLTLKTRVQANPLNTYLSTRPTFASPQPLAAATGLTIPLQITLSDIKLSAFIVLVFSRQKGLTLVFRNDPLESLKVSSTFDSIPFVRDYLQKEIDGQLRILLMDQLPAIIHRLSLRLWVPEYRAKDDEMAETQDTSTQEPVIDPFASPPQDPVDSAGHRLNASEVASMSLDSSFETHNLFSQKNLLRLATLNDSHRTLSLFTPSIRDTVFRAWAGSTERGEVQGVRSPQVPMLSRSHSYAGSTSTTYTFPDNQSMAGRSQLSSGLSMGSGRPSKPHRKRKKRVVNLRKKPENAPDGESVFSGDESYATESVTGSESSAPSVFSPPPPLAEESVGEDGEPLSSPVSPILTLRGKKRQDDRPSSTPPMETRQPLHPRKPLAGAFDPVERPRTPSNPFSNPQPPSDSQFPELDATPRSSRYFSQETTSSSPEYNNAYSHMPLQSAISDFAVLPTRAQTSHNKPSYQRSKSAYVPPKQPFVSSSSSSSKDEKPSISALPHSHPSSSQPQPQSQEPLPSFLQFIDPGNSASIAEKAWMMKMANEMARRYQAEKERMEYEARASTAIASSAAGRTASSSAPSGRGKAAATASGLGEDESERDVTPPPAYAA